MNKENLIKTPTEVHSPRDMIAIIAKVASDPNTDVEKIERLLEVQIKMMATQAKIDFDIALSGIQEKMPRIKKNGEIKNRKNQTLVKYIKYEDIDIHIRPLLGEYGFSLLHDRSETDKKMIIKTSLKHRSGHQEEVSTILPFDQPNELKNAVQAAVSTFSYGKRVNVCSLLNIVAEGDDDDGHNSTPIISKEQIDEIKDLLNKTKTPLDRFCGLLNIDKIEDLNPVRFDGVINSLNRKLAGVK